MALQSLLVQLSYAIGVAKLLDELFQKWIFYGVFLDACDELILVKAPWIQRFVRVSISPGGRFCRAHAVQCHRFNSLAEWITVLVLLGCITGSIAWPSG